MIIAQMGILLFMLEKLIKSRHSIIYFMQITSRIVSFNKPRAFNKGQFYKTYLDTIYI